MRVEDGNGHTEKRYQHNDDRSKTHAGDVCEGVSRVEGKVEEIYRARG